MPLGFWQTGPTNRTGPGQAGQARRFFPSASMNENNGSARRRLSRLDTKFSMNATFPIAFTKMSGTGNDFIVIDHRRPFLKEAEMAAFARRVCRPRFSVGADGLILIEDFDGVDFRWHFYNADGSRAEMCGNGARCAARFAFMKGIAPAAMRFATDAGTIEAAVDPARQSMVRIRLTEPAGLALGRKITLDEAEKSCHFVNTGVPHAVFVVDDAAGVPVDKWGRFVRFHQMFQPAGTNVNFTQVTGPSAITVRTYERGVEGETMACGTGAVASAIVTALLGQVKPPVAVTTSGGQQLVIHFNLGEGEAPLVTDVFLEGEASFIYEGLLTAESVVDAAA